MPPADGGGVSVPVSVLAADWQTATYTPFTVQSGGSSTFMNDFLAVDYDQFHAGARFHSNFFSVDLEIFPAHNVEPIPGTFVDFVRSFARISGSVDVGPAQGHNRQIMLLSQGAPPSTTSVTLTDLPGYVDVQSLTGDATNPIIEWSGGPTQGVGTIVTAEGGYSIPPDGFGSVRWTFVVPPGTTKAQAPILPASLAIDDIQGSWTFGTLASFESAQIGTYKNFKTEAARFQWFLSGENPDDLPKVPLTTKISAITWPGGG